MIHVLMKVLKAMKTFSYLFILSFIAVICCSCYDVPPPKNINYITFDTSKSGHILLNATIDDSINGKFMLDNGSEGCTFDSSFFYDHFNMSKFKIRKQHSTLWFEYGDGTMNISTGEHSFAVQKTFMIENLSKKKISGIIGSEIFKNKITIINFDDNKIAFVDSCPILDGYFTIKLLSPFVDSFPYLNHMKYIRISGFEYTKGENICSDFLFDMGASGGLSAKHSFFKTIQKDISRVDTGRSKTINTKVQTERLIYYFDTLFIDTLIPIYDVDVDISFLNIDHNVDPLDALRYGSGLLGIDIISKFNLIYDEPNDLLYIKPNKNYYKNNKTEKCGYANNICK
jgi:hypothetical protein